MTMGGFADLLSRLQSLDGTELTVGIQGEVAPGDVGLPEMVEIATTHEFGLGVPMRPFLRTSLRKKGKRWARGLREVARRWTRGEYSQSERAMRRVAVVAVGDVQATIRDENWVPNSPATIARKGSDKPLIDTGQLRQSIRAAAVLPSGETEAMG